MTINVIFMFPHFDTFPILYWLPVYALCWGLLWLTGRPGISGRVFLTLALGLLFLLRLPSIVFDGEINPDESQMITQALTLRHDPVYFRSVDGTTGGPLNSYFLILPSLLGLPFDYITAHLTAFGLVALCLWLLFRTARLWYGEEAARFALLPLLFTLGLTQNGDLLHYNGELVALVLLSGTYYSYARLRRQDNPLPKSYLIIGLALGLMPFGKLQVVPLAAVIGLFVALDLLVRRNLRNTAKAQRIGLLVAGGLAFPLLAVGLTLTNGVFNDFVTYYLLGNLRYGAGSDQWASLLHLPQFFRDGDEFDWLIKLTALVWLAGLLTAWRRVTSGSRDSWRTGGFAFVLLAAMIFSITRTGSGYVHYLYYLTGPLVFALAYGIHQLLALGRTGRLAISIALALFLALFGAEASQKHRRGIALNPYPSDRQDGWAVQQTPVSKEVLKYARPGEKLVVWGWRCDYYVQTQMPQGVAENHTIRSAFAHSMLATYQQRYVRDFVRSFPPVFVDAVGNQNLWMTDKKTQGHEIIKPLGQFVAAHYRYVGLVSDARLYVRYDRARGLPGVGQPVATTGPQPVPAAHGYLLTAN